MNIVAEEVEFTVDIRSMNNDNINDIANRIKVALARECKIMVDSFKIDTKLVITPVEFSKYSDLAKVSVLMTDLILELLNKYNK